MGGCVLASRAQSPLRETLEHCTVLVQVPAWSLFGTVDTIKFPLSSSEASSAQGLLGPELLRLGWDSDHDDS